MLGIFSCDYWPPVRVSLGKCLISFSHFLIGLFAFLLSSCVSFFCVFEINPLLVILFANIFSLNSFIKKKHHYLAVPSVSCSKRDLLSSLWYKRTFSLATLCCCIWDLVPSPGIKPGAPALGVLTLSH